ncbi:Ion-translocating oxidoreductase complex subunit B [Usitatibacter rugosus]|uniref:Ion-translocating oxidoreductase complex subunit B n=1 Tax=Usitatibacter rugosus TaxID=2732067 RepID=A0A6M4GWJ0_9PROT|nr:4Fe-4S binding protein [Usitatibacter rugosus]QJR11596.1 Ion-translocating oxidoreductase complex subunit B [Usitatibacter rugosus]
MASTGIALDDRLSLESRGWTIDPDSGEVKRHALASLANLEPPAAIASVTYVSHGNVLIVAGRDSARARLCAASVASDLHVTLLDAGPARVDDAYAVWGGSVESLAGYLGEFVATFSKLDPGMAARGTHAKFDLVLDFSVPPLFGMHQPPQGYYRAPADAGALEAVLQELREAVGEFEKPRYFAYRESLCAHERSSITGCNACIEVCSTSAIAADGDKVKVDPHLCMGCGACSTVCPSGAMGYQYPRPADRGAQLKSVLSAYRHAGGKDACILFHNGTDGREALQQSASTGEGLPANVIPLETWHVAAIGPDLLLGAIAFGASRVAVLCAGSETPEYVRALEEQMAFAQTVLSALGYAGTHFAVVESPALAAGAANTAVSVPATYMMSNDKRTAIEFAVEHLVRHAPQPQQEIALAPGAAYGEVLVDAKKCTLCLACAGACPASALMDGGDQPMLRFLERNCVQCGLCEKTCPEDAITLNPRLLLTPAVREVRVLNETRPFHCVLCAKPFGTERMVSTMIGRLAGHSMFATEEARRRLQMCADCRVVDMMSNKQEASVLKL